MATIKQFDRKKDRLDQFYFHKLNLDLDLDKFPSLSKLLISVFVLPHGQASVERGFSLNKSLINDNMSELTIVSQRIVKDFMISIKSLLTK